MAFGKRDGNGFYMPDPYPTYRVQNAMFPTHFDPLKNALTPVPGYSGHRYMLHPHASIVGYDEELPRACGRTESLFKRCELVNGRDKCQEEMAEVLKICPTWALEIMRDKRRKNHHINLIDSAQYRKVMEVAEYNRGRTPADISNKTYVNGTKKYLRPDTIWCDDRYADITQQEINEARARMAAKHKFDPTLKPEPHYDWQHMKTRSPDDPIY